MEQDIERLEKTIKEDIEAEILSYEDIDIQEVHELFDIEARLYIKKEGIIDFEEVLSEPDSAVDIEEIRKVFERFRDKLFLQRVNY